MAELCLKFVVNIFGPERLREKLSIVTLDGVSSASGPTERNLSVVSDQNLSSDSHQEHPVSEFCCYRPSLLGELP